ncbi:MAG: phytanoyl-CoA dioxygenase family protein [Pseudonocardiaceae bacterium]
MIEVAHGDAIERHVQDLRSDGYAIFRGVIEPEWVVSLRRLREVAVNDWRYTSGLELIPDAVGAMLERAPRIIFPLVSHPLLVGFAEAVMGPVVQLDSSVLAGDPPSSAEEVNGPVRWHRDRFGFIPPGEYVKPASIVFIGYLQDMTPEMGQLRVIPGSHRRPDQLPASGLHSDAEGERRLELEAGDIVALHHNILHSGGMNTSDRERRFFGFIYNVSMLRQEDDFDGPKLSRAPRIRRSMSRSATDATARR